MFISDFRTPAKPADFTALCNDVKFSAQSRQAQNGKTWEMTRKMPVAPKPNGKIFRRAKTGECSQSCPSDEV
jgi:hypothetical protein